MLVLRLKNYGNYIGRRPKDGEILLPSGGISRARVEAEGRNVGPRDAPTREEDFLILQSKADVIAIPIYKGHFLYH